jgi:esterase/lipase superfamily enzyme
MLRAFAVVATLVLVSCAQLPTAPPPQAPTPAAESAPSPPPPPTLAAPPRSPPPPSGARAAPPATERYEAAPRLDRAAAPAPPAAADAVQPYTTVQLFFGTDRNLTGASAPAEVFGDERGHSLIYGTCEVSIPRGHQPGELESPLILRHVLESPDRHVVLLRVNPKSQRDVYAEMDDRLAGLPQRKAFVFVHGFNNSFEDAARRTAQIYYDVQFDGVGLFYSWPSKAKARDYAYDANNADQAVSYLKAFLHDLAERRAFDSVTLVAHSMGGRVLTRAFMELAGELPADEVAVFSELILAAPDIDADVFRTDIAPVLAAAGSPVTLYASANDLAMLASKDFGGAPRAGDARAGVIVVRGVETIDATKVDTNLFWGLGHAYIADSPQMLHDLHDLVVARLRAARRSDLEEVPRAEGPYWRFK